MVAAMKVVGLTGTLGSGKSIVKDIILKSFNCYHVTLGDVIRGEIEKKRGLMNRKSLQDMGNELRQKYGGHILAKLAIEYLPRDKELIVIDGIRNPAEADWLKRKFGGDFFLIAIDAPFEKRLEFIFSRGSQRDPKTIEEFKAFDARDRGEGEPETGQQVDKCIAIADFKIMNEGTAEELHVKVMEVMQKIMSSA
jgi:dephospho-CoA kinase